MKFVPKMGQSENIDLNATGNESAYGTTLSQESMKVIAESIGLGNLQDEAAKVLAEDISFKLKEIVQVRSLKFAKLYNVFSSQRPSLHVKYCLLFV